MPNIIRIRNLDPETELSGVTFPVDKNSYTENAKQISISDLKKYILSGVTGATYDMSKYLAITGGTMTGPIIGTEIKMDGHENFATADFFTLNSDASGTYGLNAVGYSGANRKIFRTGIYELQNAFTIDWFNVAGRFAYAFSTGDMIVDGCVSGNTFVKFGGGADQSLQADGSVLTLISGEYFPTLTIISDLSDKLLTHAIYSRVGDVVHVKISGYLTPTSGIFPKLQFDLPTDCSMPEGVKIGIGTLWNWDYITPRYLGYVEVGPSNTAYFCSNTFDDALAGVICDFVTEFDYSLTGGITTTTTTLAPTTTTTSSSTSSTTTSTTTVIPFAHVAVNNTGIYGGDSIISVTVNSINIDGGIPFPISSGGYYAQGTTTVLGTHQVSVEYTTSSGGNMLFYNPGLVNTQVIGTSGTASFTFDIVAGDYVQIVLSNT